MYQNGNVSAVTCFVNVHFWVNLPFKTHPMWRPIFQTMFNFNLPVIIPAYLTKQQTRHFIEDNHFIMSLDYQWAIKDLCSSPNVNPLQQWFSTCEQCKMVNGFNWNNFKDVISRPGKVNCSNQTTIFIYCIYVFLFMPSFDVFYQNKLIKVNYCWESWSQKVENHCFTVL